MQESVLLIDDNAALMEGLARALRREPYRLLTCTSAARALKLVEQEQPAVVVCDLLMPEMEGTELLARARAIDSKLVTVLFTGYPGRVDVQTAVNYSGIFRFLVKPCSEVRVAAAIREALAYREKIHLPIRLIEVSEMQRAYIEFLEKQYPGICDVRRDGEGRVVVGGTCEDLDDVLSEMFPTEEECDEQHE